MNLKEVRIHEDNGDHWVVSHGGGTRFRVARNGLEPSTVSKIEEHHQSQMLADGGEVDDSSDGSLTRDLMGLPPLAVRPELQSQTQPAPPVVQAVRPIARPSPFIGPPVSAKPDMPTPPPGTLGAQAAASATPPIVQEGQSQAHGQKPDAGTGLDSEIASATRTKSKAEIAAGEVAANKALEETKFWSTTANDIQTRSQKLQADFAENQRRSDEAFQAVASGKIDPEHWYNSRTTGGEVRGALAMVLGGLGGGMLHQANPVVAIMNSAIERDIDAQKANLDNKKGLLSYYMQRGHSIQEAADLARADYKERIGAQHMAMAGEFAGPEARLAAQQSAAQTRIEGAKTRSAVFGQALENLKRNQEIAMERANMAALPMIRAAQSGAPVSRDYLPFLNSESAVDVGGGRVALANSPAEAKEIRDARSIHSDYGNSLQEIEDLAGQTAVLPKGELALKGKLALQHYAAASKALQGRSGLPRSAEEDQIESAMPNPVGLFTSKNGVAAIVKAARMMGDKHLAAIQKTRLIGGALAAAGLQ